MQHDWREHPCMPLLQLEGHMFKGQSAAAAAAAAAAAEMRIANAHCIMHVKNPKICSGLLGFSCHGLQIYLLARSVMQLALGAPYPLQSRMSHIISEGRTRLVQRPGAATRAILPLQTKEIPVSSCAAERLVGLHSSCISSSGLM